MSSREQSVDPRVVKALGHPLRQRVLTRLNQGVASPSELAEEFGERLPNISYHFRILVDLGAIELVSRTPRRGAVEHHYRAAMRPFFSEEDWLTVPASARRTVLDGALAQIFDDVEGAAKGGGFEDDLTHVSRSTLRLDGRGWKELSKLLDTTRRKAQEIQDRSAARAAAEQADTSSAQLVLMGFQNP